MKSEMLIVDTETGGLDPEYHALVEVAVVDAVTGDEWCELIQPEKGLHFDPKAMEVHGITRERMKHVGLPEKEAMTDLALWVMLKGERLLGGCSVSFDVGFLKAAFGRHRIGWPFSHRTIELRGVAWLAHAAGVIELPGKSGGGVRFDLDAILGSVGLRRSRQAHGALEDARLTLEAFNALVKAAEGSRK
jgi:DNA polymerase III epsilon subunit-like protein